MPPNVNDYWSLTEKERAALTRKDVERYFSFELMQKNVLSVDPLVLLDVTPPNLPRRRFVRIRFGTYDTMSMAFETEEAARAFLALKPVKISGDYCGSQNVEKVMPFSDEPTFEVVDLPTHDDVQVAKSELAKFSEAMTENARRRQDFERQSKVVDQALKGLWDDYFRCVAKGQKIAKIASTFAKYQELALGDAEVAQKFLRQVFGVDELAEAEEWTGTDFGSKRAFTSALAGHPPASPPEESAF